jgi:hypothetical protein
MKKCRRLIVNSHFQMRKAFIIGLVFLILSGAASLTVYYITYQNNIRLTQIIGEQKKYDEVQTELCRSLVYVSTAKMTRIKISVDKVESDMKANSDAIKSTITEINRIKQLNSRLILAAVIFSVLQLIVLLYLFLKHTAGVSGQMKLLNLYLDEMIDGRKPVIRKLRDSDDFRDVFAKLTQVVKTLILLLICSASFLRCSNWTGFKNEANNTASECALSFSGEMYKDLTGVGELGAKSISSDCAYMYIGGNGPTPYIYKINISTNVMTPAIVAYTSFKSTIVGNYLWTVGGNAVQKIDKKTLVVEWSNSGTIDDGRSIAFDGTYVWCADRGPSRRLHRIHSTTHVIDSFNGIVNDAARQMCFDGTYLWLTCDTAGVVKRINPADQTFTNISILNNPWGICYDGTNIIVACMAGAVSKINPVTAAVTATGNIAGCTWICHLSYDGRYVWCSDNATHNVKIIDPVSLTLITTLTATSQPFLSCPDGRNQWVAGDNDIRVLKLVY